MSNIQTFFHWDELELKADSITFSAPNVNILGDRILTTADTDGQPLAEVLTSQITGGSFATGAPVALPISSTLAPVSTDGITITSNTIHCPNAGLYRFELEFKLTTSGGCNMGVLLKRNAANYLSRSCTVAHLASNDVKPYVDFQLPIQSAGTNDFTFFVAGDSFPTPGTPPTWDGALSSVKITHIREFPL